MIPIRDTIPSRSVPVVTWALIAANLAVFLIELRLGPDSLQAFLYLMGLVPARYSHIEWARWADGNVTRLTTGDRSASAPEWVFQAR